VLSLPVSGLEVRLRLPDGHDDVALAESPIGAPLLLRLIGRLASREDGSPLVPGRLPVADLEAILVALRRTLLGDSLTGEVRCPAPSCGSRMDVTFGLGEYLAYRRPRRPRRPSVVVDATEPGWFERRGDGGAFRLPDGDDLVAIDGAAAADRLLAARCLRPADSGLAKGRWRRRAESAMAAMAPTLSGSVQGSCPECHATVEFLLDVPSFVLAELRAHAISVFDDVHRIAGRYGWSETAVLALPRTRRLRYAALIRDEAA
jgi:hypothetical protein